MQKVQNLKAPVLSLLANNLKPAGGKGKIHVANIFRSLKIQDRQKT
jgi:hypothetical protein